MKIVNLLLVLDLYPYLVQSASSFFMWLDSLWPCSCNSFNLQSGGEYDGDRKFDDLKILYRTYAEESFPDGRLQEEKVRIAINL